MTFGDVNLSENSIRGPPHNPGQGGWPTIRYFNKETGISGGSYQKKTHKVSSCIWIVKKSVYFGTTMGY